MRLLPRVRLLFARRPWLYWLCVSGLVGAIAFSVAATVGEVDRQRQSWGETAPVVVASEAVAPGQPFGGNTHLVSMPVAMIPQSALRALPIGVARQHVAVGEVVVSNDVSLASGPAALLPDGWLAITVEATHPQLFTIGDRAAIFAFGQLIVDDAVVIVVGDDFVVVGVNAVAAPRVADAANQRLAILALSANPQLEQPVPADQPQPDTQQTG
jgi:hypothetical protein